MRRTTKYRELEWELRNEAPNHWAVVIDGKIWKVFAPGKNQQYYLANLCRRKSEETGKKWTLTPYAG